MLDRHDNFGQEAQLEYLDANIRVVRPGANSSGAPPPANRFRLTICVTGVSSARRPMRIPEAVLQRLGLAESDGSESGNRKIILDISLSIVVF